MHEDLLFHITTKNHWEKFNKSGKYEPESIETEGFIHLSTGNQIQDTANRLFAKEEEILILVIDITMLRDDIKYERDEEVGEHFPHLYAPLSSNAIMDKIPIKSEEDGTFNITFTTS